MSETGPQDTPETVWWINTHEPPGRAERVRRWLFETATGGTYIPREKIPPATTIPIEDIDDLEDTGLQEKLRRQHSDVVEGRSSITIPIVTVHTRRLVRAWTVPTKSMLDRE